MSSAAVKENARYLCELRALHSALSKESEEKLRLIDELLVSYRNNPDAIELLERRREQLKFARRTLLTERDDAWKKARAACQARIYDAQEAWKHTNYVKDILGAVSMLVKPSVHPKDDPTLPLDLDIPEEAFSNVELLTKLLLNHMQRQNDVLAHVENVLHDMQVRTLSEEHAAIINSIDPHDFKENVTSSGITYKDKELLRTLRVLAPTNESAAQLVAFLGRIETALPDEETFAALETVLKITKLLGRLRVPGFRPRTSARSAAHSSMAS